MGDTSYTNWKARLAGAKVPTHDGDPDVGFYRKPIRSSREDGHKITGWYTVAYFTLGSSKIVGTIGDRDMTENEVADLWTYVCQYPIPEEVFRDVEDGKPWPRDLIGEPKQASRTAYPKKDTAIPTATEGRAVTTTDNAPPEEVPIDVALAERVKNAKGVSAVFTEITSDEQMTKAAGARNLLNELKGEAEKAKEVEFRPLKNAADAVGKRYNPIITDAENEAKRVYKLILAYQQKVRDDAAKKAAEEKAKQDEIDAANARAADRAIANGMPEPEPVLIPSTPAPEPAPAPVARVNATYGRAAPLKEKTFVVIEDQTKVYEHFAKNAEVIELLTKLAQQSINAGVSVPGTTTRTGLI